MELLFCAEYWKLLSIPVVAGIVGWGTNWVAIRLTFYPLEYRGVWPFGWQGIIPSKAEKMARIFVDSTMQRLGRLPELFERMGPDRVGSHIVVTIRPHLDEHTNAIMQQIDPSMWNRLPSPIKEQIYERVRAGLEDRIGDLMAEVGERFEELFDLKHMVLERLTTDKNLINRLFQVPGEKEFAFIIKSGLHFGLLFGAIQLTVWVTHPAVWVLPAFGFLVGYATNWFALNIIFRPLEPHRIGRWNLQGLFLKRQEEVAAIWCHLVTHEIITLQNVVREMLFGTNAETMNQLIREHLKPLADTTVGKIKPLAKVVMGAEGFERVRESVGDKAIELSPEPFADEEFLEERAAVIEYWLTKRMRQLPPEEFQDLLRPCFKEDEWKLLVMGAVLGLLAGLAQLFFVFGG